MKIMTLTELSERWKNNKKSTNKETRIGIRIGRNPISHHLLILLEKLNQFKKIDGFALTKRSEYEKDSSWYRNELPGEVLVIYENHETGLLNDFDMVLLPESNFDAYSEYPKELIKIGLPHGVDIPLSKTIMDYGGGMIFDYILSPTRESPGNAVTSFQDLHHQKFRNHASDHVCQIPFGFPKLDEFLNAATRVPPVGLNSIAYHVALLSVEEEKSIRIIESTLKKLLENFPHHRIIFRPYKYDYQHAVIKRCIEIGRTFDNFHLSTAESYVQDYSTSVAMVCHRAYKAHLFSLATGRPIFLCHPDGSPTASQDPSVEACPENELVEKIKSYIDKKEIITPAQRIENCLRLGFHNPGSSVEYLVSNIHHILEHKPHKDWIYYRLDSANKTLDSKTYVALQVIAAKPANMVLRSIASKYPSQHEMLLFLADSYSRKTVLLDYYSKLSLHCFNKLMATKDLSPTLLSTAGRWWTERGNSLLDHIYGNENIDPRDSINAIDSLEEDFLSKLQLATRHFQKETESKFTEHWTLIDLETREPIVYHGELALYGARNLAGEFIRLQEATSNIRMIADPAPRIIGTELGGLPIRHPDALQSCDTPILICSFTYLLESFLYLRKALGPDRKLYALCKDRQIFNFLPLLQ
ncbi:MAG: hypothetical protein WBF84_12150 [Castellaniella sp.]|uniref:hypothetical protein n=1 Tax=Castellaniella sp. TaxID=1955812 RepID=UPI003C77CD64